jgi:hypothetical protein
MPTPTSSLGMQDFFTTTLSAAVTDANQLTIYLNSVPTNTEGYLVIDYANSTMREIIFYSAVGANYVTVPADGRGQGGTTAQAHDLGADVRQNMVAGYHDGLKNLTTVPDSKVLTRHIADANVTIPKIVNPYVVKVARSGSQSIPNITFTKVQLNSESFDLNNNFDSSTNYVYTAPVTGYYFVNGLVKMGGAKMVTLCRLVSSGGYIKEGSASDNAAYTDNYSQVDDVVKLTAGQTLELQVYHTFGAAASLTAANMTIHLLSI